MYICIVFNYVYKQKTNEKIDQICFIRRYSSFSKEKKGYIYIHFDLNVCVNCVDQGCNFGGKF